MTEPRTDRMRVAAAFRSWKINLAEGPGLVRYSTITPRGWREAEIEYDGDALHGAHLISRSGQNRRVTDVDALLDAADIPRHGKVDPDNTNPATTYVCILTDHLTGEILHVELLSDPPRWDTGDTTDGVWKIYRGHINGGSTTRE